MPGSLFTGLQCQLHWMYFFSAGRRNHCFYTGSADIQTHCRRNLEYTVPHLETAPYPIVSFGQGCEGEPLLMWETIREAIIEIRKHTDKGSININTNGSKPDAVKALCEAGLNSIRVSTNSARREIYTALLPTE